MTVGIALVGSGIFAREEHLPAIQTTAKLSLKAIYSRSLKSAQTLSEKLSDVELYSDDQTGQSFDDLLKRDDIKGVIIALPILAQPEYIKKALAAGKHVLAEKPIAKDVATAQELLSWTQSKASTSATYTVAENFRFLDSFLYGSQQISSLGRILTFRARVATLVQPGGKYFETAWRKVPEYQGGFLLDGGVHIIAAIRLLLSGGKQNIKVASAFTAQLQEHLPPVDTLNSTLQLSNGSSGTLSISFGTTDKGSEYLIACENGSVHVSMGKVTVTKAGKEAEVREFKDEGNGVRQEVSAWAESIEKGVRNEMQSPEEALRDLEVLEACLRSGEQAGKPVELTL
ncbi:NAD(P)-binding protein [Cucurbitaria berberidis CBS 394.84]|uniref:NAD(P)-binding protein n=1 Tax=Cucurbitaria berberidis CBS 394.84 TaxID=1168544 RepID=A0A9P4GL07_9PLEO|nr:NAD(P)-binding protein [Cucurbitaria berberidis CBS 394.84]KAF1847000.1 NAD(P)-binding protein [Cucurbitaria berberidis CBS 394.84]